MRTPTRVLLMLVECDVGGHAGQDQMAAVEFAFTKGVEALIVNANQRGRSPFVFPYPFGELLFNLKLFGLGGNGFVVIDDAARSTVRGFDFVSDGRRAQIENVLDQLEGIHP
jgi:hypothetical protein